MKYTCLVVEDEILLRQNLCKKLSQYQSLFEVTGSARNGRQALEMIEKDGAAPSLVITDIQMPGMDGLALAEHLSVNFPQTKILILSGYNDFGYAQRAIRYNVCDYLLKPVSDDVLYEALLNIKTQLDSRLTPRPEGPQPPQTATVPASPREIVERIQSYILAHYKEDISLEELAAQFQFSSAYLRRIFKQYTEYTPSQYLMHLRIDEAKRLLLTNPELNISTIGKMAGYQDQYYFSRIFKKCTGMYPTEYRGMEK